MHERGDLLGAMMTTAVAHTFSLGLDARSHGFLEFDWHQCQSHEALMCATWLFLAGVLCSAAGIGGGGIYVVLLMVMGQLTPHDAVPLSKAIVLPGAVATLLVNMSRASSSGPMNRKVINFTACKFVVPAALAGTFVGVLTNALAPGRIILIILTFTLIFMTCWVTRIAWTQWQAQVHCAAAVDSSVVPDSTQAALEGGGGGGMPGAETRLERARLIPSSGDTALGELSATDMVLMTALLFIVILSGVVHFYVSICRQGKTTSIGGVEAYCEQPLIEKLVYPGLHSARIAATMEMGSIAFPMAACSAAAAYWYISQSKSTTASWDIQTVMVFQTVSFLTGILAGLVGVGGGLFFSPFFLIMGMDPAVAVGTSSTCVLFTSSSTATQYILTDRVNLALAVLFGVATACASLVGTTLVHRLQDTMAGKTWFITTIVAVSVGISSVLVCAKMTST